MSGTHDAPLVWLSILIAVTASYTALDLAGRAKASFGSVRRIWLMAAAATMGGGIWAMHFVAMLAYRMPGMDAGYDAGLTLLSLGVAVGATLASFTVMSRRTSSPLTVLVGAGVFMGLGVCAMHYIGMAAMRMPAHLVYLWPWVVASVAIAVVAATVALWLAFHTTGHAERVFAALVMGGAVSGMHYAAMQGAVFLPMAGAASPDAMSGIGQTTLAVGISVASFAILAMALVASVFDRRIAQFADHEAQTLRASEERFRELYRGTPLPLHSLDRAGLIEQVSDTWLALTGYSREDVVGRPVTDFVTPESAARLAGEDAAALARDGFVLEREHRVVTKSGAVRHVLFSSRMDPFLQGGVIGGMMDVTDRRNAEEALRQAQKLETMGQLTGGVAHDFNNLLAVIVGNLDLLRRRVADDPKTLRLVDNAMEGAARGSSLTQRLLAFARRQDLKPAAVDVRALVEGMSDLLRRSLGPMIRIETSFPADLPLARVDGHQLEMAILNLAVNARDAVSARDAKAIGGLLVIGASEMAEAPAGLEPGRYIRVEVTDDGCGMDAETLARANEPFFTTKGVGKGTGLGLSMAQGLAAQSGGRLDLRSRVGFGTTVDLWLPVAVDVALDAEAAGEAEVVAQAPSRPLSILVVDDDRLVLDNTVAMLEDLGHRVVSASSGSSALVKLSSVRDLDIVVTDQLMPGMSGLQLAESIATSHPYLPILIASGYSDLCDRSSTLPMLAKPFNQASLASAVHAAIAASNVISMEARRSQPR